MMSLLPEYRFFLALAAGVIVATFFLASREWYLNVVLLLLLFGILISTRSWPDRAFYIVCSGELLVISCSIMNLWTGLFSVCMLAGIFYSTTGFLESRQDLNDLALFCGSSCILALLIQFSNHVLVPLVILGGITALILTVQSVRMYQFRKHVTGA